MFFGIGFSWILRGGLPSAAPPRIAPSRAISAFSHVFDALWAPSDLLRLDVGVLDDLRIGVELGFEISAPSIGLAADGHHALLIELRNHLSRGQSLGDLAAQALDDRRRRSCM